MPLAKEPWAAIVTLVALHSLSVSKTKLHLLRQLETRKPPQDRRSLEAIVQTASIVSATHEWDNFLIRPYAFSGYPHHFRASKNHTTSSNPAPPLQNHMFSLEKRGFEDDSGDSLDDSPGSKAAHKTTQHLQAWTGMDRHG
jgi:hypothetical protein